MLSKKDNKNVKTRVQNADTIPSKINPKFGFT